MKKLLLLCSLTFTTMVSCSNEEIAEQQSNNYEKRISVTAEDMITESGTRTSYSEIETGYSFAWSKGDAIGVFPENGYQTAFPISNGYGAKTASFNGGDWALKPNAKYAAYYPLVDKMYLEATDIPVDYTGQVQNGNGSTVHLSKYDYMYSTFKDVDANGSVNFKLHHLGCLVQFKLTMPKADTFLEMEIESDKTEFITSAEFNLYDEEIVFKNIKTSKKIAIGLTDLATTTDDEVITITAMFAPVKLTGSKLTLTVKGLKTDYVFSVIGRDLPNGKSITNNVYGIIDTTPYITFFAETDQTLQIKNSHINLKGFEYSVNYGKWKTFSEETAEVINFGGNNGELRLRGSNGHGINGVSSTGGVPGSYIIFGNDSVKVRCSGDIRTLADYANYNTEDTSDDIFSGLFYHCTVLTEAPNLPATNVRDCCYYRMFEGCTSLKSAPELPATKVGIKSYYKMFLNCTSLTEAPTELPADSLQEASYFDMFLGCTSLKNAPKLPATTLADQCYEYMFSGCTSLTKAPKLPATTLADHCYCGMFKGCTALTEAPELPATTLKFYCYAYMFEVCKSLTEGPMLPAKTLVDGCYEKMFMNCSNLSDIVVLASEKAKNADSYTTYCFLDGASSTGTFTKSSSLGSNTARLWFYIPTEWKVINYVIGN